VCIYAEILENINIGIIVLDVKKQSIVFKNTTFIEMFKDTMTGEDDYNTFYKLLIPKNDIPISPLPTVPKPITLNNNKVLGYSIYRVMERFVWIFIRDITDKMRLESIAESLETSKNIGYIFSGVRHELGNPVNAIKTTTMVLKENLDSFPKEKTLQYIERILDDIKRLENLLMSLKSFNMYESLKLDNIELSSFMKQVLSLVERDCINKAIEIKYTIQQGVRWGYGDSRALLQVMLNIITNAMDALEGRENPFISITISKNDKDIGITIEDNGCGISRKDQKNLFMPFLTTKQNGTGLGLSIVRKLLASMNGTIKIESQENIGTIVYITIPAGKTDSEA